MIIGKKSTTIPLLLNPSITGRHLDFIGTKNKLSHLCMLSTRIQWIDQKIRHAPLSFEVLDIFGKGSLK